ncbi:unnamed protein product [Rhodiola kirilowii]
MLLSDLIRRRLVSLLRPWLVEEPEMEVKLGFMRSHVIARNLRLDAAVLNRLLDDPRKCCFKDVTVDYVEIRVSNWSAPFFVFEVAGIRVKLAAGEQTNEEGVEWRQKPYDTSKEDFKKILAENDSEATAIHEFLEKICGISSRNSFANSVSCLLLKHSQLRIRDVKLQVQFPSAEDSLVVSIEAKDFNAESEVFDHVCLLKGLVAATLLPVKEGYLALDLSSFEIRVRNKDHEFLLPPTDISSHLKVENLQVVNCDVYVPDIKLSFAPSNLSVLEMISKNLRRTYRRCRSGKQLWKLARCKILYSILTPKTKLHQSVIEVGQWLAYVNTCKHLLLHVGYPMKLIVRDSTAKMMRDKQYSRYVKNQWKVISAIEDDLPAEAIIQALQVARYQASLENSYLENDYSKVQVSGMFKLPRKLFQLLHAIYSYICFLLLWLVCIFQLKAYSVDPSDSEGLKTAAVDCFPLFGLNLNVGEVSITISPVDADKFDASRGLKYQSGISQLELVSFCLVTEALLLRYIEGICEQSMSVFCGTLKTFSFDIGAPVTDANDLLKNSSFLKGHKKSNKEVPVLILESEPAQLFHVPDNSVSSKHVSSLPVLQNIIRGMWSNWNSHSLLSEDSDLPSLEDPFLLLEVRHSVTESSLSKSCFSSLGCALSLGKVNLTLGLSSILSVILLLRQVGQTPIRTAEKDIVEHLPQYSTSCKYPLAEYWGGSYKSFFDRIKVAVHNFRPNSCIQLGIFISGLCIQVPSEPWGGSIEFDSASNHLAFEVQKIEVSIWPALSSDLTALDGAPEWVGEGLEGKHKMPMRINIVNGNSGNYKSQGHISLDSYFRVEDISCHMQGPSKAQQHVFFMLDPVNVKLSAVREHLHSFSASTIAFSAALTGLVTGFTFFICMDELKVLSKVIASIHAAASFACTRVMPADVSQHQGVMGLSLMLSDHVMENITAEPIIPKRVLLALRILLDVKSVNIALHNSTKGNTDQFSFKTFKELNHFDLPDCGIWVSIQHITFENSCEEDKTMMIADLSGAQLCTFECQSDITKDLICSEFRTHMLQSCHCIYEMTLAKLTVTSRIETSQKVSSSESLSNNSEIASSPFDDPLRNGSSPLTCTPASSSEAKSEESVHLPSRCWITINFAVSEIFITPCSLKSSIIEAHQLGNFIASVSLGGLGKISGSIQGGTIFIEVTALGMVFGCFSSYLYYIMDLLSAISNYELQFDVIEPSGGISELEIRPEKSLQMVPDAYQDIIGDLFMELSQFSLVIMNDDNTGCVQELILEVDLNVKLEETQFRRAAVFNLSRVSIFSQILQLSPDAEVPISRLSSATASDPLAVFSLGDSTQESQATEQTRPTIDGASCSSNPTSLHKDFCLIFRSCILNNFGAVISIEKPLVMGNDSQCSSQVWAGSGTISGCDLTITITEIKMLLFVLESFSDVFSKTPKKGSNKTSWQNKKATQNSSEEIIADGAIVAIQDVQQHLYVAVESIGSKYGLHGVVHYSLVGERALFRVKYHRQSKWCSDDLWFSLISMYAKTELGEPLRLNYQPGSGFVNISSADDNGGALWKKMPYTEGFEADPDWEPYNQLAKNKYILVNKKNSCSVAFIDGVPEFVPKPGNSFKFKVIQNPPFGCLDQSTVKDHEEDSQVDGHHDACAVTKITMQASSLPCLDINFEKVSLTILYELSDTRDKLPLLKGCIDNIKFVIQLLESKIRVISSWTTTLAYFNAQKNVWNELVPFVDLCLYYRSSFPHQAADDAFSTVPGYLYFRLDELDIKLSELSMDILLLICGELDLAGPFSIKQNIILANCCKVENQTSVNTICQFYDHQHITISRRQSASVYLRKSTSAGQPEKAQSVSIQLAFGTFSTSPIHLSLNEARTFAWRTRLVSLKDTRTYPGPFVVIDILTKSEDGLMALVSPLVKIHNETSFDLELRFQRPQQKDTDLTTVLLKPGDVIDDSLTVFDASNFSGGAKMALKALTVGNFLLSFRPQIHENLTEPVSSEWSDDLKGGKPVKLSGLFDKLKYKVRKAVSLEQVKRSFTTVHCSVNYEETPTRLHFLIQSTGRDVPIINPGDLRDNSFVNSSPVSIIEQKQIFILPTVRVSNLLQSEIQVLVTENDPGYSKGQKKFGNHAVVHCESTCDFYVDPASIYFTFTISKFNLQCKAVDTGECVNKLNSQKKDVSWLDISLDFDEGKYFASLRLYRGHRGILEAAVFTSYALKNDTEFPLFFSLPYQKSLSWSEVQKFGGSVPLTHGFILQPREKASWLFKSNKARIRLYEEDAMDEQLDLDALSGLTEISLKINDGSESAVHFMKFGVSLGPSSSKAIVQSQTVTVVSRYVIVNESKQSFMVRQCYSEESIVQVRNGESAALQLRQISNRRRQLSIFENILRKHGNPNDASSMYIQFQPSGSALDWSGPVCISSLGRFFIKFRKIDHKQSSNELTHSKHWEFAVIHVMQEGSTFVLRIQKPPMVNLPYRIENKMRQTSISFYQKDSSEPEILASETCTDYVWDNLTRPHKLVIQINGTHALREINLDKVRSWKPFSKSRQNVGVVSPLSSIKKPKEKGSISYGEVTVLEMDKVGYEVCADGPTRVLRICEYPGRQKQSVALQSSTKYRLRLSSISIQLLQHGKQEVDATNTLEPPLLSPIIVARLVNTTFGILFTNLQNYYLIRIQSLTVDEKWVGAPFAAVLRRHQSSLNDVVDSDLRIAFIMLSSSSNVKQIKYGSILLQPISLNLDEETLMKVAQFWRTSLSNSNTPSRQFYFDHFEIHPIKVVASFLPGDSYASYDSAQETLRTLLHSVVKVPTIKNMTVELNGVLITHALITTRELCVKCAQHYSWYAMRAIYIAKGSPLLPPAFASVFDDLASSSLDVFFDPSRGSISLPGLTVGTFKLLSKCIDARGFSGTKRYFGDLGKTIKTAGSNVLFGAITEVSDSILKGAEASGVNGMVTGFHQGILRLAMEPSILGHVFMEGGPDRKIKLDRSPGIDELYIEGYLQAMLDTLYRQEYLRVRVIEDQVVLKNLPPNSALIDEIIDRVKGFLVSKALLKGDASSYRPLRHLRAGNDWKIGPTVLTLCEHLFVSFAIRMLRKQTKKLVGGIKLNLKVKSSESSSIVESPSTMPGIKERNSASIWKWGLSKFILSGMVAYVDGRLCRHIPNPIARRIVSGFLLSFLDSTDNNSDKNQDNKDK